MLTPLIVVAVLAAVVGAAMAWSASPGFALIGLGIVAGTLARMAQARAYQKEHMDTLRIQADALQKLLAKSEAIRGQWAKD
jgi:hypothetical protein